MLIAITREVSRSIDHCQLTHVQRRPIDVHVARAQHARYERCLAGLGCTVHQLAEEPALPDSVFVEDTAVVMDELAVITRPGAASRQAELEPVAEALRPYRQLACIEPPGTLDGGDVLRVDRRVYVGLSSRTNREGVAQLERLLAPHGYAVLGVEVSDCLHLKTAVTRVSEDHLLLNPAWVPVQAFEPLRWIEVDPAEPSGANALLLAGTLIYPSAFPRTRQRLEREGIPVHAVDISELAKAEGGVTCCSLILEA